MTVNRETLDKLGRFLQHGLRIGAGTVSIVELLASGVPPNAPRYG
jgi:hypothetical protein